MRNAQRDRRRMNECMWPPSNAASMMHHAFATLCVQVWEDGDRAPAGQASRGALREGG